MAPTFSQIVSIGCAALLAWAQAVPAVAAEPPVVEVEPADPAEPAEPENSTTDLEDMSEESGSIGNPDPSADALSPAPSNDMSSRLAILPTAIDGMVDEGAAGRLHLNLRKGFSRGSFGLVDPGSLASIADANCDGTCMQALKSQEDADYAVKSRILVEDRDYIVELDLVATADNAVVASTRERCDLCGLAEVGQLLEAQAVVLGRKLEDLIKGPPVIVVDTVPSGALIFIDNQLVGTSPLERPMIEGEHIVRVMLDGYVPDEREVNLIAGVRETLELPLKRTPKTAKFRAFGWASLSLGIPALAVGAALIYLENTLTGDCNGVDALYQKKPDGTYDSIPKFQNNRLIMCPKVFRTKWGGAAAIAGGTALVTAGVILLLRTRNRSRSRKHRNRSRRRAQILPTGLGISGRF
ncbi:MAG TPA: PEGA domain-containing protein [Nannocystis exedens]|nr:PEGA domain-containing protein [Nannocystis exedens]